MGDSKAKVGLSFMYDCPAGLKDVSFDLIYKLLIIIIVVIIWVVVVDWIMMKCVCSWFQSWNMRMWFCCGHGL